MSSCWPYGSRTGWSLGFRGVEQEHRWVPASHLGTHITSARILGMFTSQQWKHLSNDFLKSQQEKRHSWFKTSGTIKKFRAGLSIFSPIPK